MRRPILHFYLNFNFNLSNILSLTTVALHKKQSQSHTQKMSRKRISLDQFEKAASITTYYIIQWVSGSVLTRIFVIISTFCNSFKIRWTKRFNSNSTYRSVSCRIVAYWSIHIHPQRNCGIYSDYSDFLKSYHSIWSQSQDKTFEKKRRPNKRHRRKKKRRQIQKKIILLMLLCTVFCGCLCIRYLL